ncbi:NAD(P)-binding domain-containing protein [Streptomyces longwoodensis]|jgi:predicted dinucleotide-binding enzyme|uniref:NADPH-dependent F420 reductase n=1 Tax=Streptomyces longwoodensis TaxID=68231 RepID=UPI00225BE6AB|nr:NAD(P)-binding domain-containing protein [Streptomyces longwoodensis]MCX4997890.1 NAD(P)-binding domain-containing protein [Streptomyces longwoodensis]WRY92491.1 NAD(P)-binding domain-containing protein [Streptomyces longwoodensis]WTI43230.1 NAD(P)-binding domain-containing protein [Streptomyces longwoodensis]WUC55990.1 NAD(P)-binding domain-containing protein [Streptomyces longwoodensis]
MTTIAVLGNGRVGGNLAAALTRAGHEVRVADRTPGAAAEAARTARIVINATPGADSLDRLTALREDLRGKILVDVSNATVDGPDGLPADLVYPGSSLAEHLQEALPGTAVVKTLNTMLFPVMTAPAALTRAPDAFLSGDDPQAKRTVRDLLVGLGWRDEWITDLGGIRTARATEAAILFVPHVIRASGFAPFAISIAR